MVLRDSLPADYRHVVARPEGFEHALTTTIDERAEDGRPVTRAEGAR
jgi:hypothetical protein